MNPDFPTERDMLRAEIASAAARMIAEDGADYATAKRKAQKQVLGDRKVKGNILPDNSEIEEEVRAYNALFFSDTQPLRVLNLRRLAVRMMKELHNFSPFLTGAVLNGTAGEHSDIHLQLFVESPKDVVIYLSNKNVDFEVSESPHFNGRSAPVETVSFLWQQEGFHLALYEIADLHRHARSSSAGKVERADVTYIEALIAESTENET